MFDCNLKYSIANIKNVSKKRLKCHIVKESYNKYIQGYSCYAAKFLSP